MYCRGRSAELTSIGHVVYSVVGGGITDEDFEAGRDVGRSSSCLSRRSQPHELVQESDQEFVHELRQ